LNNKIKELNNKTDIIVHNENIEIKKIIDIYNQKRLAKSDEFKLQKSNIQKKYIGIIENDDEIVLLPPRKRNRNRLDIDDQGEEIFIG
jgi:hypothetical protein